MKNYIKLSVICFVIMLTLIANAQEKKVAQAGYQFLKIDMSPRAAAMGSSVSMICDDATAMFYNPAGLAKMESTIDGFISYNPWIAGFSYIAGAGAINLGDYGKVGLSFIRADYGEDFYPTEVSLTSSTGYKELGGYLMVEAYTVGIGYAASLTDKFSVGGQIKYCYQHLGGNTVASNKIYKTNETHATAFDIGTIFYPGYHSLRVGISVRNFASEREYEHTDRSRFELPINFVIGAGMDILDLLQESHEDPLLINIEMSHPRDYSERLHIGAEYTYAKLISIRAGYKFNYDIEGFSAGIGFNYQVDDYTLKIGYSYSPLEYFDASHRLSFGIAY